MDKSMTSLWIEIFFSVERYPHCTGLILCPHDGVYLEKFKHLALQFKTFTVNVQVYANPSMLALIYQSKRPCPIRGRTGGMLRDSKMKGILRHHLSNCVQCWLSNSTECSTQKHARIHEKGCEWVI